MYNILLLANVYINSNIVVIRWKNYQKHEGRSLVMSLLALGLTILCVSFEDSNKIMWTLSGNYLMIKSKSNFQLIDYSRSCLKFWIDKLLSWFIYWSRF